MILPSSITMILSALRMVDSLWAIAMMVRLPAIPATAFLICSSVSTSTEAVASSRMMIGEVLDVMKKLAESGMTMIVVTHEMRFAREVSSRTLFLDGGHIEEDKPSHELFESPESKRLISFLEKVL